MSKPSTTEDGWWLALLWIADDDGVVPMRDLASPAGPPADPPLARLGPSFAGALSGMILEEAGRLSIRLATVVPGRRLDPALARPGRDPRGLQVGTDAGRGDASERAGRNRPRRIPALDRRAEPPVG